MAWQAGREEAERLRSCLHEAAASDGTGSYGDVEAIAEAISKAAMQWEEDCSDLEEGFRCSRLPSCWEIWGFCKLPRQYWLHDCSIKPLISSRSCTVLMLKCPIPCGLRNGQAIIPL